MGVTYKRNGVVIPHPSYIPPPVVDVVPEYPKEEVLKDLRAFKTRVRVNNKQHSFFMDCVSARRVAYNFALGTWKAMYEAWKEDNTLPKPSAYDIDKIYNSCKKDKYPWMYDSKGKLKVPSCVSQEAIKADIKFAFKNFFERVKKGVKPGYPKFKKRGTNESFTFTTSVITNKSIVGRKVSLPKGLGVATLGDELPDGVIKSTTVSYHGGKWYMSFLLEGPIKVKQAPPNTPIGVDLGVSSFAILSSGKVYPTVKALEEGQKKLTKLQRKLAKMTKGSNRYKGQKLKIAKHYKKVADIRADNTNKVSKELTTKHDYIVIEDLKVSNMSKSSKGTLENPGSKVAQKSGLNKAILNQGWFDFRRQLEYKSKWAGGKVVAINPKYTSQACNCCGAVDKENRKSQAVFKCVHCGHEDHADTNAAKNILKAGLAL